MSGGVSAAQARGQEVARETITANMERDGAFRDVEKLVPRSYPSMLGAGSRLPRRCSQEGGLDDFFGFGDA